MIPAPRLPPHQLVYDDTGDVTGIDIHGHLPLRNADQWMLALDHDPAGYELDDDPDQKTDWDIEHTWRTEHIAAPDGESDAVLYYTYHPDPGRDAIPVTRLTITDQTQHWCWNHPHRPWKTGRHITTFSDITVAQVETKLAQWDTQPDPRRTAEVRTYNWSRQPRPADHTIYLCGQCDARVSQALRAAAQGILDLEATP